MKTKTKITLLILSAFSMMITLLLPGASVGAQGAGSVQFSCPDGLIYSLESKKCQRITETRNPNSGNGSVTCPSGYKSYYDSVTKKNSCIKAEDTAVAPCPEGEQGRGADKPGCWKQSNDSSCLYGNASTVSEDKCWTAGRQTDNTPQTTTEAKDKYVQACVASGKSEQECKTSAEAIANNCAEDSNPDEVASCIANVAASEYGKCDDGSKPSSSTGKCADGSDPKVAGNGNGNGNGGQVKAEGGDCGGAKTAILDCGGKSGEEAIAEILRQFIFILSVGVGIVAVGGIVFGAVLYASARDNASQTQQAVGIIRNTVIGIILYVFMVSLVNWLVPGGVIG